MRIMQRTRSSRGLCLVACLWLLAGCGSSPQLALDPLPLQDDDRYDIPRPAERERDDYYDVFDYAMIQPVGQWFDIPRQLRRIPAKPRQARNTTPLDEIQDSSWWTNRIGKHPITPEELHQGANRPLGPDVNSTWTIVRAKTEGVTPGFTIVDGRGDAFVIKFDPMDYPEMATGAEAISSRLFWAIGYHVPENYIVRFDPADLVIDPDATVPTFGGKIPMRPRHLNRILNKVPKGEDGRIRALASRYLSGKPIGPFAFQGVRKDDPNDVIRHEHRRELRAYRVFTAWLNHNDCRSINTLDTFVEHQGRSYVQHNLIDFGATLGSRSHHANLPFEGHEYLWDTKELGKSLLSVGLYERPWLSHEFTTYPGTGNLSAEYFWPPDWQPDYRNPAFDNMTQRDAFWAAKIVMRFDDQLIRAAVEAAEFTDRRAAAWLTKVIQQRRDLVGKAWMSKVNPLDNFQLVERPGSPVSLDFDDLAVHYGFHPARRYSATLQAPDGVVRKVTSSGTSLALGDAVDALRHATTERIEDRLLVIDIQSELGESQWTPSCRVSVYVSPTDTMRIVRIEREE